MTTTAPAPQRGQDLRPDATEPTPVQLVTTVARREVSVRLRDKTFIVSAVLTLVVILASVVLPTVFFGDDADEPYELAVAGLDPVVVQALEAVPESEELRGVDVREEADAAAAEAAVLEEDGVDAALLGSPDGGLELVGGQEVPAGLASLVREVAAGARVDAGLAEAGVPAERRAELLAPVAVPERTLEGSAEEQLTIELLAIGFAFVFFFTVFSFGSSIAQSVVEEKQSRIVELLVAVVPPRLLLAGKVLGNTALALAQVVLILAVGLVAASLAGQGDLVGLLARSSGWFVLFFLLGFLMLSCLWAVAGSLASRLEDLQSTSLPLNLVVTVPLFAAVYVTEPGTLLTALSYVPFTAPLVMPRRIMIEDAAAWEPLLAAGLVLATAVLLIAVGARLYRGSLMRTRGRSSLREAWQG